MVEVSGAVGAKQVHEAHAGGSATPGCSAATVGLSLAEAKAVLAGLQRHLVQVQRGALPRSGDAAMWGTAAAEGSAASAAAIVVRYGGGPRPAV